MDLELPHMTVSEMPTLSVKSSPKDRIAYYMTTIRNVLDPEFNFNGFIILAGLRGNIYTGRLNCRIVVERPSTCCWEVHTDRRSSYFSAHFVNIIRGLSTQ